MAQADPNAVRPGRLEAPLPGIIASCLAHSLPDAGWARKPSSRGAEPSPLAVSSPPRAAVLRLRYTSGGGRGRRKGRGQIAELRPSNGVPCFHTADGSLHRRQAGRSNEPRGCCGFLEMARRRTRWVSRTRPLSLHHARPSARPPTSATPPSASSSPRDSGRKSSLVA